MRTSRDKVLVERAATKVRILCVGKGELWDHMSEIASRNADLSAPSDARDSDAVTVAELMRTNVELRKNVLANIAEIASNRDNAVAQVTSLQEIVVKHSLRISQLEQTVLELQKR